MAPCCLVASNLRPFDRGTAYLTLTRLLNRLNSLNQYVLETKRQSLHWETHASLDKEIATKHVQGHDNIFLFDIKGILGE